MNELILTDGLQLPERIRAGETPALFCNTNEHAKQFWEFFITSYRNKHTRLAYLSAAFRFADWMHERGIDEIEDVEPGMVGFYVDFLNQSLAAPSVKLHLTAIRALFDYLVVQQVIAMNPAKSVKAPKHSVTEGKTPTLSVAEMRQLFDSIEMKGVCAFRDRAIIATMAYSFARVSAVNLLKVKDYYTQSKRSYYRLHEKGGKYTTVPTHHTAQQYMDEYLVFLGEDPDPKAPLFQTTDTRHALLTGKPMSSRTTLAMVKRRCARAGLSPEICNHSFRGTGITTYMENGGTLEMAARIAGHASTTTTQLYDRRDSKVKLDEIERIHY